MSLRFGFLGGEPPPSGTPFRRNLAVQKTVRWTRPGFELVCREARARGQDPASYIRNAALRQAQEDSRDRARRDPRNRRPSFGDGGE